MLKEVILMSYIKMYDIWYFVSSIVISYIYFSKAIVKS